MLFYYIISIITAYILISLFRRQRIDVSAILQKADIRMFPKMKDRSSSYDQQIEVRAWDILLNDPRAVNEFMSGTLGFIESYMKGGWSCKDLKQLLRKIADADLENVRFYTIPQLVWLVFNRIRISLKDFNRENSKLVAVQHYDLPRPLYEIMLGKTMTYSCAYFSKTDSLDQAQINKMDLIARKMHLKPGMNVLDIGCGWGSLANYLVTKYRVKVLAITISKEQIEYCRETFQHENLEFKLIDYRDIQSKFDRIVSVGMFEHVTSVNYDEFFRVCQQALKSEGLILLHTITGNRSHRPGSGNPFIMKYIFPNSQLPSLTQITGSIAHKFIIEDIQNFGLYYAKTLANWYRNFDVSKINKALEDANFPPLTETFIRMWKAYLLMSQVGFESQKIFLHQFVLSRGQLEVYKAAR